LKRLDSRFHGNDEKRPFQTFYEIIILEVSSSPGIFNGWRLDAPTHRGAVLLSYENLEFASKYAPKPFPQFSLDKYFHFLYLSERLMICCTDAMGLEFYCRRAKRITGKKIQGKEDEKRYPSPR
jgi:hypothetical protein